MYPSTNSPSEEILFSSLRTSTSRKLERGLEYDAWQQLKIFQRTLNIDSLGRSESSSQVENDLPALVTLSPSSCWPMRVLFLQKFIIISSFLKCILPRIKVLRAVVLVVGCKNNEVCKVLKFICLFQALGKQTA